MSTIVLGSGIITYFENNSLYTVAATGSITVANNVLLGPNEDMYVLADGTANSTTADNGARIEISSGGIAYQTTFNTGAYGWVQSSGTAVGVYLNSGSILRMSGTLSQSVVYGGSIEYDEGGRSSQVTIDSGGVEEVLPAANLTGPAGYAINTTLAGGTQIVASWPLSVGPTSVVRNTVIDKGGYQYLSGDSYNATINGGGSQSINNLLLAPGIYEPSQVTGDVINAGGVVRNYGGITNETTINAGGLEIVHYGATAENTTVEAGGYLVGLTGGSIVNTSGDGLVISSGLLLSEAGGIETQNLIGVTLLGAGDTEYVLPLGNTDGMVVSQGVQYVLGGMSNATTVFSGSQQIVESGTAKNTVLDGGVLKNYGGILFDTTIGPGGVLTDYSSLAGKIYFVGSGGTLVLAPQDEPYPIGRVYPSNIPAIYGFSPGDVIELANGRYTMTFGISNDTSFGTTVIASTANEATGKPFATTIFLAGVISDQIQTTSLISAGNYAAITELSSVTEGVGVACFVAGTRIFTERGNIPVQDLRIGDIVAVRSHAWRPIKWIGRRDYDGRLIAGNRDVLPVCIKANALEDGVPSRDLWVSPGHAIYSDGGLVHVSKLVNGVSIVQADHVQSISYFHIELDTHEIIFAENCPVETFMDENFRGQFQNAIEYKVLYPNSYAPNASCLPRIEHGLALRNIRHKLNVRAGIALQNVPLGPLRGFIDVCQPELIVGWVQNVSAPEEPVSLDIVSDGILLGRILADRFRVDVQEAGLGSGYHGFEFPLEHCRHGLIYIRRTEDLILFSTILCSESGPTSDFVNLHTDRRIA